MAINGGLWICRKANEMARCDPVCHVADPQGPAYHDATDAFSENYL